MKAQLLVGIAAVLGVGAAAAVDAGTANAAPSARAELKNTTGQPVGEVTLEQDAQGLLLHGTLHHLPAGTHAFHIHQVGRCETPFKSAGDHFNPTSHQHGLRAEGGQHGGDLPNVVVPASGDVSFEAFAPGITLTGGATAVLDADGAALIVHAKPDDYATQPTGAAGDRIACGVISKTTR